MVWNLLKIFETNFIVYFLWWGVHGIQNSCESLHSNKTLTYLNLGSNSHISINCIQAISKALTINKSILALDLSDIQMNIKMLNILVNSLKIKTTLENLSLSWCFISDSGNIFYCNFERLVHVNCTIKYIRCERAKLIE